MHEAALTRLELETDLRAPSHADELELVLPADRATSATSRILRRSRRCSAGRTTRGDRSRRPSSSRSPRRPGLIIEIGRWVIERACRETRVWQMAMPGRADLSANVNLSARQVLQPTFVATTSTRILAETGLSPERLVLEITEGTLLSDVEGVGARLAELRVARRPHRDRRLRHRLLVARLPAAVPRRRAEDREASSSTRSADPRRARLVEAIVTLARSLDLDTVAEGIEREEQRDRLREIGCGIGQGYLFSRPVAASAVPVLLQGAALNAA